MHPSSLLSSLFAVLLLSLFLFTCTTAPTKGPNDRSNTTITLVGKSSKNIPGIDMVEDSVGNTFSIGFYSNFPNYLDSVQLYLVIPDLKDSLLKTFYKLTSLNYTDTSWHSMIFSDSGTQKIYCVAYINEYNKPATDTLRVIIHGKPVNYKPSIAIAGLTTISIGQQCNLAITANDTDKTQTVTLNILRVPSGAVFNAAGTFIWTPPKGFMGNDSAIFVAKDNGYPVMYDTAVVIITVLGSSNNHAPAWQKKTINEVGQPGVAISITLSDKCTDPDGDTLTFLLLSGAPDNDSIIDAATNPTYTFTPGAGDTGVFNPRIVAKDPQGLADTLTIALTISAQKTDSFTITYNGNGNTGGTVPIDPAAYVTGATVTVKTNSGTLLKTGATFAGWNTAADGSGTSYAAASTFTMGSANVMLYAKWTQNVTFALTITAANGSVTKVPDLTAYDSGTVVTLTPVPAAGYHFSGWSGGLTGSANPATITMTGAKSVTATFALNAPNSFALTVLATNGTVTKLPDAAQYDSGTVVTLTPSPAAGYQFTGWSGGLTGTTNPGSITMTGAKSVTANFAHIQCTVTFSSPGALSQANPSTITVNAGATVGTLPNPPITNNYDFSYWKTSDNTAFTATTPVNQNMTVTAVWKPILDNDGNQYNTVTIGNLTWLATNLKTISLPHQQLLQGYTSETTGPAYAWYLDDPANGSIYGALYNWAAATNPDITPTGWHVATLDDWNNLINNFPDTATAMSAIKESGTTHWMSPNPATNASNFSALPGGFMVSGMSHNLQYEGDWWTTTPYGSENGYSIYIGNSMSVSSSSTSVMFLSIRCVRNKP